MNCEVNLRRPRDMKREGRRRRKLQILARVQNFHVELGKLPGEDREREEGPPANLSPGMRAEALETLSVCLVVELLVDTDKHLSESTKCYMAELISLSDKQG